MSQPIALYVHIPFCETRCPYCDFNTYAGIESLMPRYVDALCHDLTQWGAWLGRPRLASLFFGGGTPSYLPTRDIGRLMGAITTSFDLPPDAEATLEANPGDCARERLAAIRAAGVNRLSIGVQSLDDNELRLLGRRHSADDAAAAVQAARQAGFDNLSIDLMFGLPYQFVSSWEHTLERAIELLPDHVSAYALTLEGGTEMEASVRQGKLPDPDPDLAAEMYLLAQAMFSDARYEQYEISNWAAPSRASTHNLAYWQNRPYLGVGPGRSLVPRWRQGRDSRSRPAWGAVRGDAVAPRLRGPRRVVARRGRRRRGGARRIAHGRLLRGGLRRRGHGGDDDDGACASTPASRTQPSRCGSAEASPNASRPSSRTASTLASSSGAPATSASPRRGGCSATRRSGGSWGGGGVAHLRPVSRLRRRPVESGQIPRRSARICIR